MKRGKGGKDSSSREQGPYYPEVHHYLAEKRKKRKATTSFILKLRWGSQMSDLVAKRHSDFKKKGGEEGGPISFRPTLRKGNHFGGEGRRSPLGLIPEKKKRKTTLCASSQRRRECFCGSVGRETIFDSYLQGKGEKEE